MRKGQSQERSKRIRLLFETKQKASVLKTKHPTPPPRPLRSDIDELDVLNLVTLGQKRPGVCVLAAAALSAKTAKSLALPTCLLRLSDANAIRLAACLFTPTIKVTRRFAVVQYASYGLQPTLYAPCLHPSGEGKFSINSMITI